MGAISPTGNFPARGFSLSSPPVGMQAPPFSGPQVGSTWLPARSVALPSGDHVDVICRTHHFRAPAVLKFMPAYLSERFLKTSDQPVKVAVYAGADGSDARSMGMLMADRLGLSTAQRFHFDSIDIDPYMTELADRDVVPMNGKERALYRKSLKISEADGLLHPLEPEASRTGHDDLDYAVDPALKKLITARQGDFFKDAKKPMDSQVVMARNLWDHFTPAEQETLARNLYKNMPEESVLIIGSEAVDTGVRDLLAKVGFHPVDPGGTLSAIFEKSAQPGEHVHLPEAPKFAGNIDPDRLSWVA